MEKKITWNDFNSENVSDLMNFYKVSERGLQQHLTKHLDGASYQERKKFYEKVYNKRR